MSVICLDRNIDMTSRIAGTTPTIVTFRSRFLEEWGPSRRFKRGAVIQVFRIPLHGYQKMMKTRQEPQRRPAQRCRVISVGETLFVRQTLSTLRLTKLLLMTLSAIRRDRAAAAGVIMKKLGPPLGSTTALLGYYLLSASRLRIIHIISSARWYTSRGKNRKRLRASG